MLTVYHGGEIDPDQKAGREPQERSG